MFDAQNDLLESHSACMQCSAQPDTNKAKRLQISAVGYFSLAKSAFDSTENKDRLPDDIIRRCNRICFKKGAGFRLNLIASTIQGNFPNINEQSTPSK